MHTRTLSVRDRRTQGPRVWWCWPEDHTQMRRLGSRYMWGRHVRGLEADRREAARRAARAVEGWLSDAQGEALFEAAFRSRAGAIVEIGSWKGRSTVWLASGAQLSGRRVYAVDPHENSHEDPSARTLDEFLGNLARAGVAGVVEPVVLPSEHAIHAVEGPVGLLFVDGDHSVEGARRDAELWLPRILVGGTVMFHDVATSGYAGPRRVFQKGICWSQEYHRIRRVGSMGIAERTPRRATGEAIRATIFGILLYWYDVQGALKRALRRVRGALGIFPPASSCR